MPKQHPLKEASVRRLCGRSDVEGLTDSWEKRSPSNEWSVVRKAELAYGRLHFQSASALTFELIQAHSGDTIDSFEITK